MVYRNVISEQGVLGLEVDPPLVLTFLEGKMRERVSYLIFGPGNVFCGYDELVAS